MESAEFELKAQLLNLQEQFSELLEKVKDYETNKKFSEQKMKISKPFSGHYLHPYNEFEYRRTEYDGTIVWEYLDKAFGQWFVLDSEDESKSLEETFQKDCVIQPDPNSHNHEGTHYH